MGLVVKMLDCVRIMSSDFQTFSNWIIKHHNKLILSNVVFHFEKVPTFRGVLHSNIQSCSCRSVPHMGTNESAETHQHQMHFPFVFITFCAICCYSVDTFSLFSVILAFVCALFQVSWAPSSLSLLTNVLSTEIPVAVHRSVVCVRGQRLAFTKRPRRFQLTAAVALAMCGWRLDTCYTASHLLNPSLLLPKPCTGTAQGQSTRHTHTHTHLFSLTSHPWQPFPWNQDFVWPWRRRSHEVRRGCSASMTSQFVVTATWSADDKPRSKSRKTKAL